MAVVAVVVLAALAALALIAAALELGLFGAGLFTLGGAVALASPGRRARR